MTAPLLEATQAPMDPRPNRETTLATATTWVIVGASVLLTLLTAVPGGPWSWRSLLALTAVVMAAAGFIAVRRRALAHHATLVSWWSCVLAGLVGLGAMTAAGQWAALGLAMAGVALGAPTPRWGACALLGLVLGSTTVPLATHAAPVSTTLGIVVTCGLIALVLYVLTRLVMLTGELRRSRAEVARLEVEQERARISRDLHDVIGRTMTAASLRNQTALALVEVAPDKAAVQIQATHDALAQGQARLREITSGPVVAGLDRELDAASALCAQLGITLDLHADEVDDPVVALLAARVVREAVTNMLKHSRPHHCTLTVRRVDGAVDVIVDNDGCPATAPRATGTGLRDLARRVEEHSGRLSTERHGAHFVLTCHIPTTEHP